MTYVWNNFLSASVSQFIKVARVSAQERILKLCALLNHLAMFVTLWEGH